MGKFLKQSIKLILLLVILVFGAEFIANQWVFGKYLPKLKNLIKENYNIELVSEDNLKFKLLPFPHISLEKPSIYDAEKELILKSEEIDFRLDIEKFIKRKIALNGITFKNTQFYLSNLDSRSLLQFNKLASLYQEISSKTKVFDLKNIEIDNSSVIYTRNLERYMVKDFNFSISLPDFFSNKIRVKSDFFIEGLNYVIDAEAQNFDKHNIPHNLILNVKNNLISLKMDGSLKDYKNSPWYIGNLQLNLNVDQHSNSRFFQTIAKKDTINAISANLEFKDNILTLHQFNNNLKRSDDIKGKIILDINAVPRVNCDLNVKALDMDLLLSSVQDKNDVFSLEQFFTFLLKNRDFSIPEDVSSSVSVKIQEIKILNNFIRNFNLSLNMFTSKAFLNDLSFEMPGNSTVVFNGIVTTNKIRPKFTGSVVFGSKSIDRFAHWLGVNSTSMNNYNNEILMSKSDIVLLPHIMELNNFQSALDTLRVIGKVIISENSSQKINTYASMDINKLDTKSMGGDKLFNKIINILYISDGDISGETFVNLTNDFKFLRNLKSSYNLDLNVHQLMFYDQLYDNFFIAAAAKQDKFRVIHLEGQNQLNRFSGNGHFSVSGFKPYVEANLQLNTIDWAKLKSILPSEEQLQKNLLLYNQKELRNQKKTKSKDKVAPKLNFFSSAFINGKVNIKADNLKLKGNTAQNFDLQAESNNGVINFDHVKFMTYGGDLNLTGNITTLQPISHINLGIGAYNLDPKPLFENYLMMKDKIGGYVSFSGIINTSGTSWPTLKDKMKGHIKIIGKNITWNGFGLDKIIKATESNATYTDNIKILDYYSKYGSSFFNSIQGEIEINNGVATMPNLLINTNRATGSYAANYDIDSKLIKSITRFSFIPVGQKSPLDFSFSSSGQLPNLKTQFQDQKIIDHLKSQVPQIEQPNDNKELQKPDYLRDIAPNIVN